MKKNVRFTQNGIYLESSQSEKEGKEIPLYSGSIHYWRMAPETWETALINAKNMGFSIVETYIPWGVHEPERNEFDYGKKDVIPCHTFDFFDVTNCLNKCRLIVGVDEATVRAT